MHLKDNGSFQLRSKDFKNACKTKNNNLCVKNSHSNGKLDNFRTFNISVLSTSILEGQLTTWLSITFFHGLLQTIMEKMVTHK